MNHLTALNIHENLRFDIDSAPVLLGLIGAARGGAVHFEAQDVPELATIAGVPK